MAGQNFQDIATISAEGGVIASALKTTFIQKNNIA
jgi:hypothetical protein